MILNIIFKLSLLCEQTDCGVQETQKYIQFSDHYRLKYISSQNAIITLL